MPDNFEIYAIIKYIKMSRTQKNRCLGGINEKNI